MQRVKTKAAARGATGFRQALVRAVDLIALYFPGLLVAGWVASFYLLVESPSPARFAAVLLLPYAVPLWLYRLITLLAPIREGGSALRRGVWSTWFIAYRLQLIYAYFPFLEGALLAIPGAFSLWLRAWGSRVGKRTFYAATMQITDRGHLDIGDDVFFGNQVYLSPHVVKKKASGGVLYFKRIAIGDGAAVGAGCRLGPGVKVHAGAQVPLLTDLYVREEFPKGGDDADHS